MKITAAGYGLESFWEAIRSAVDRATSLETAAQAFADRFYAEFVESTVLVRVFGTLAFSLLPAIDRQFVRDFAEGAGRAVSDSTTVLTLLGTRGLQREWNRPATSRGHRAIPLLSDEFVGEIPMIARLLAEIGVLESKSPVRSQYVTKHPANANGLFFVGDARVTTDERGRLIIPAVDFVERFAVKSVFGFGGPYSLEPVSLIVIVFCRETLLRSQAARFVPLVSDFKAATEAHVAGRALFSATRDASA